MKRTIKLAQNILLSNFKRLPQPYKLTFIITHRCNCRCKMCLLWQKKPQEKELSLAEIEEFFQNNPYFSWVNLSGGEVSFRQDLIDIVKVVSNYSPNLYLLDFPTNGILSQKTVEDIKCMLSFLKCLLIVTVSIDGYPQIHNQIRNFPNAWERAIQTYLQLRAIRKRNFKVFIGLTISAFNQDYIEKTYHSLEQAIPGFSFQELHLNIAHISEHYYNNPRMLLFEKERVIKIIEDFQKRKRSILSKEAFLERLYQGRIAQYLRENRTPVPCQALNASCFIDPFGNVYPCSGFNERIGQLRESSYRLQPLWNSALAQQLRQRIKDKQCPQCWTPCEAYQSLLGHLVPGTML